MKALIRDLEFAPEKKAYHAARRLIARHDPACVSLLLPLALSSDIQVQSRAVMVLSHFIPTHHGAIWNFMHPRLLRGDKGAKVAALQALEDLPVAEAVPLLKQCALRPGDSDLRASAVGCLSSIARTYPKFRPALSGIFLKSARSRNALLRFSGLESLNELQNSRFDRILLSTCNDSDSGIRTRFPSYARAIAARRRQALTKQRRSSTKFPMGQ